jgi:hypothetical protein
MKHKLLYPAAFAIVFLPIVSTAEESEPKPLFVCRSNVSFEWKRDGEQELQKEFFVTAARSAPDEARARGELALAVRQLEQEAMNACRSSHENMSGCIGSKFANLSDLFRTLSFDARTKMQNAIEADCKIAQGLCHTASSSEVQCEGPPVVEEEGEGKDDGKAKKR